MGTGTKSAPLTLGKRIARARERVTLTQLDLSQAMDVSVATVSRWERDTGEPTVGQLLDLSRRLGVSIDWLASGQTRLEPLGSEHSTSGETVPAAFAQFLTTPIGRLAVDHGLMLTLQRLQTPRPPTVALYKALTVALVGADQDPDDTTPDLPLSRRDPRAE